MSTAKAPSSAKASEDAPSPARPKFGRLAIQKINELIVFRNAGLSLRGNVTGADLSEGMSICFWKGDKRAGNVDLEDDQKPIVRQIAVKQLDAQIASINAELAELGYSDDADEAAAEPGLPLGDGK